MITCRRRVCFSRISDTPPEDNQIRNFTSGEWKHRALQELLGPEFSCEEEIIWSDIISHPDAIWKPGGIPTPIIEIKTTNSVGVSRKCYDSHIRQLKAYLSIVEGVSYGKIFYMYLGTNLDKVFYEYLITVTEEEKKAIREKLLSDSAELQYGIDCRNAALVGHAATDKTYLDYQGKNFLCRECLFFDACTRARRDSW